MSGERIPERVMQSWYAVATHDGWDDITPDTLYWAAVDALAWSLIEQTMDTADREPSRETLTEARETAERMLAPESATSVPTGLWRVTTPDGTPWTWSHDEDAVRTLARPGDLVQQQYRTVEREVWMNTP